MRSLLRLGIDCNPKSVVTRFSLFSFVAHFVLSFAGNFAVAGYRAGDSEHKPLGQELEEQVCLQLLHMGGSKGKVVSNEEDLLDCGCSDFNSKDARYRRAHRFMASYVNGWQAAFLASSKGSTVSVFGANPHQNNNSTCLWNFKDDEEESMGLTVPKNDDYDQSSLIGLAVDTTNDICIANEEAQTRKKGPLVHVLLADGRLCSFLIPAPADSHFATALAASKQIAPLPPPLVGQYCLIAVIGSQAFYSPRSVCVSSCPHLSFAQTLPIFFCVLL